MRWESIRPSLLSINEAEYMYKLLNKLILWQHKISPLQFIILVNSWLIINLIKYFTSIIKDLIFSRSIKLITEFGVHIYNARQLVLVSKLNNYH